jgi:hypothetical protein
VWEVPFDAAIIIIVAAINLAFLFKRSLDKCLLFLSGFFTLSLSLSTFLGLSCTFNNLSLFSAHFVFAIIKFFLDRAAFLDVHSCELLLKLADDLLVFIEIDLTSKLRVLLNVLQEHIIVLLIASSRVFNLTLLVFLALFITSILFKVLKFPQSMLLSLAEFRISFLHEDNRWESDIFVVHVIKLHKVNSIQVESQDCIVVIEHFSQMSVHDECLVIVTEITCSGYLNLYHLEFLLGSGSTHVDLIVGVFYI